MLSFTVDNAGKAIKDAELAHDSTCSLIWCPWLIWHPNYYFLTATTKARKMMPPTTPQMVKKMRPALLLLMSLSAGEVGLGEEEAGGTCWYDDWSWGEKKISMSIIANA